MTDYPNVKTIVFAACVGLLEIMPGDAPVVTIQSGDPEAVQRGDVLHVGSWPGAASGGAGAPSGFQRQTSVRGGRVAAMSSASVTGGGSAASTATASGYAGAGSPGRNTVSAGARNAGGASSDECLRVIVPIGTDIEIKNHVGALHVGAVKGNLTIKQIVNGPLTVDEVVDFTLKMAVNAQGRVKATGKVAVKMAVNSQIDVNS